LKREISILWTYGGLEPANSSLIDFSLIRTAKADPSGAASTSASGGSPQLYIDFGVLIFVLALYGGSISMVIPSSKREVVSMGKESFKMITGLAVGLIPSILGIPIHKCVRPPRHEAGDAMGGMSEVFLEAR
jgi:hypothetical protein